MAISTVGLCPAWSCNVEIKTAVACRVDRHKGAYGRIQERLPLLAWVGNHKIIAAATLNKLRIWGMMVASLQTATTATTSGCGIVPTVI
jgi:hypothetical protein